MSETLLSLQQRREAFIRDWHKPEISGAASFR